jgi:FkbM family methyltransferase
LRAYARPLHSAGLSRALAEVIERANVTTFWDIGANIGAVSLPLLDKFRTLNAVLFEPSAEVAGRLIRNLGNNPNLSGRAVVMNVALSNSAGMTRFFVSGEPANSGVGGLATSANRSVLPVWVQSFPGDQLVDDGICVAPQLIKIDVEGFEIEVLRGLERTLRTLRPPVVFEHSVYRFKERQRPLDEVVSYLKSLGYAIHALDSDKPIGSADLERDADWIARPVA